MIRNILIVVLGCAALAAVSCRASAALGRARSISATKLSATTASNTSTSFS